MYRAVARYAREHDLLDASDDRLVAMLDEFEMHFVYNYDTDHDDMRIDGINREDDIRSTDLALVMRPIVTCRPLRSRLVAMQQKLSRVAGVVGDGRDMGTVVFPHAPYKYFLICDLEVRVKRRAHQLKTQ